MIWSLYFFGGLITLFVLNIHYYKSKGFIEWDDVGIINPIEPSYILSILICWPFVFVIIAYLLFNSVAKKIGKKLG